MLAVVTPATTDFFADQTAIVIVGTGFDPIVSNNTITFNEGVGTIVAATTTAITVEFSTPPEGGDLTAVVVSAGISSGTPVQVATVVPVVTPSSENLLANATTLTILGSGFDTTFGNNSVSFNNGAIGTVTASTANSLTVTLGTPPTTAGDLTVEVTTNSVTSAAPI